ncbi:MAG: ATP-binding protein [Lachnospiraceae bacterium]|nr:ATP-binding protein [Lachnospiraceae bacterium]
MIGRQYEVKELNRLYDKNKAELVAVYGRRRVGKTYLIDETFEGRITFRHAGLAPEEGETDKSRLRAQLDHFYSSLELFGVETEKKPDSWFEAFLMLEKHLQKIDDGSRQLVFFDELPWLDTPRSRFVKAFEGFWNNWGCHRKNLMVVVCGSANSWILDELINNHGGLYGRITYEIKLSPFTLSDCREFYKANNINFSDYDIVQSYMIFGGIPYYLGYMNGELSLAQNVDRVFFAENAKLKFEYDRLFESAFVNPEAVKTIVDLLYTNNNGFTRPEITSKLGISDGGRLSRNLNSLIASDFIMKYVPFGSGKRDEHYKLVDPFCIFYNHFVRHQKGTNKRFWQQNVTAPAVVTWRGLAFERVCFNHIEQIKAALGIADVITSVSAWTKISGDDSGTQIDMLILRNDNVINMCEIKYYSDDFVVDNQYYRKLVSRQELLAAQVSRKYSIYNTLITTFGLKKNEHSGIFTRVLNMNDLFAF